jgi:hypothetical protein
LLLPFPEGQVGETWELSKKQLTRSTIYMQGFFIKG